MCEKRRQTLFYIPPKSQKPYTASSYSASHLDQNCLRVPVKCLGIIIGPDKMRKISTISINSQSISTFDHLLESSRRDDSNKWSNVVIAWEIEVLEFEIRI